MKYSGSCHCGNIKFEVEGELTSAIACNCSICSRKGSLLWFVPRLQFHLLSDAKNMTSYLFNKHIIEHQFCKTCGMHPFAYGVDRQGNAIAAINIRCLDNIDFSAIPVNPYDGKNLK